MQRQGSPLPDVKRISVLPVEFSVDGGELTPTMKIRRYGVVEKYADQLEALYAG